MAVIEGHAEHVMDAVAPDLLPSLPKLRAALDRRRKTQSGLSRLFAKLLGLELKLRQYEQGKAFCDAVVARAGTKGLEHVFSGPEALPDARPSSATRRPGCGGSGSTAGCPSSPPRRPEPRGPDGLTAAPPDRCP